MLMIGMLFLSLAAPAQLGSRTTCQTAGNQTSCDTRASGVDWSLLGNPYDYEEDQRERRADEAERRASVQQALRARVGRLVADDKCADAKSLALRSGDLELAAQVKALCD